MRLHLATLMSVEKTPPVMTLYADDYLSYDLSHKADTIVSNSDTVSLYFKTSQPNALLFYTGMQRPLLPHRISFHALRYRFHVCFARRFSCLVLFFICPIAISYSMRGTL